VLQIQLLLLLLVLLLLLLLLLILHAAAAAAAVHTTVCGVAIWRKRRFPLESVHCIYSRLQMSTYLPQHSSYPLPQAQCRSVTASQFLGAGL
jgi:hypothetical protein